MFKGCQENTAQLNVGKRAWVGIMDVWGKEMEMAEVAFTEVPLQVYFHNSKYTPWPKAEVRPAKPSVEEGNYNTQRAHHRGQSHFHFCWRCLMSLEKYHQAQA